MKMIQQQFAERVKGILADDTSVVGVAIAGSWLTNEIDEFSDLDLVMVTKEKVSDDKSKMQGYANRLGELLSSFTGEHVGEPRLLICLYNDPVLHVDIKFLTTEEFGSRIENPVILLDRDGQLQKIIDRTKAKYPMPDYQWIEDRFWIWVHYASLKIGRGEYFEALDFLGFLRMVVLGPLLHIKNGNLPRGVRKVETQIASHDFEQLKLTIAEHNRHSLIRALENSIRLYQQLRTQLFGTDIILQKNTEERVILFLDELQQRFGQEQRKQ